jgi:hypothetical protein
MFARPDWCSLLPYVIQQFVNARFAPYPGYSVGRVAGTRSPANVRRSPFRTEPAKLSPHQTSGFEEAADREDNPLPFSVEDQRDNVADDQACQNSMPTAFNKPTSGCPSATIPREC